MNKYKYYCEYKDKVVAEIEAIAPWIDRDLTLTASCHGGGKRQHICPCWGKCDDQQPHYFVGIKKGE